MSSNERPQITDYSHPADDPAQIEAMRLAISLRDVPVARSIGRDVLSARIAWEQRKHPPGRGACAEDEPCEACARAYAVDDDVAVAAEESEQ